MTHGQPAPLLIPQGGIEHRRSDMDHSSHATADHGAHAGHHTEMFRLRFWWSLLLSVPVVATSHMVMDWFGYEIDFYGIEWIGPVLGTVIFLWAGWPFLAGGRQAVEQRRQGVNRKRGW